MVCNHITNLWKKRFEEWNIIQSVRNLQKILSFYQQVRGDGQNLKDHWPLARRFLEWMKCICGIHKETTRNLNFLYLYFQFLKMFISCILKEMLL